MGRMIKRFNFNNSDITLDSVIEISDPEIIYEVIFGIFHGISKGLDSIDLFEVSVEEVIQIFSIPRPKWIKALNKCMEAMVEIEDYETCAEIQKAISILSKNI